MPISGFDRFVCVTVMTCQVLLLLTLLRKRMRDFPIFTIFVAQELLRGTVGWMVCLHASLVTYKHYYWSVSIFDECLQLVVLYEIAVHVFCPTGRLAADVRRTLIAAATISIVAAAVLSILAQPATLYFMQTVVIRSDFFSAVVTSELFVCMVVLSATFGLPWKTHAARIAQGLGTYSLVCVGLGIAKIFYGLQQGNQHFYQLDHARSLVGLACEAFWVVTLWREAPAPTELPDQMRNQIYTLQRQVENDLIRVRSWRRN